MQASFAVPSKTIFEGDSGDAGLDAFLSTGQSVAGTVEWKLGAKGCLRAKAEYLQFGDKDSQPEIASEPYATYYLERLNYDMKVVGLGADYLYGFKPSGVGPYVLGGIGYYVTFGSGGLYPMQMRVSDSREVVAGEPVHLEGRGNSVGASLGAGWRFSGKFACELRFTTVGHLTHETKYALSEAAPMREDHNLGSPYDATGGNHRIDLDWAQVSLCYRF
jgi:hypothetical protein